MTAVALAKSRASKSPLAVADSDLDIVVRARPGKSGHCSKEREDVHRVLREIDRLPSVAAVTAARGALIENSWRVVTGRCGLRLAGLDLDIERRSSPGIVRSLGNRGERLRVDRVLVAVRKGVNCARGRCGLTGCVHERDAFRHHLRTRSRGRE